METRRGDFAPCLRLLEVLDVDAPQRLALASACWFADLAPHALVTLEQLARLEHADVEPRRALLPAARALGRAHALAFDAPGLAAADAQQQRLALGLGDPEAVLGCALSSLWCAVGGGSDDQTVQAAQALARDARAAGLAAFLVEATALQALALGAVGSLEEALEVARRAARMAQTEGLRQEQYLTGLVLARVRRHVGQPHLASRILSSLRQYASTPWHNWIDWELALSSGAATVARPTPPAPIADAFTRWAWAAEQGDAAVFSATASEIDQQVAAWSPARIDWRRARAVLDVARPSADAELDEWRAGASSEVPFGLGPLLGRDAPFAYVIAGGGAVPLRVGRRGVPLQVPASRVPDGTQSKQQRAFTLVSVVALAGDEGIEEEAAFKLTYGFSFQRELHRDVFNVLIHRVRGVLEGFGQLERGEGRLRLRPEQLAALPDPRCAQPLGDRVLSFVSRAGGARAKEISQSLGVSLRSAQQALEVLVDDGACQRSKQGRAVAYQVEDTTFREPTNHGG